MWISSRRCAPRRRYGLARLAWCVVVPSSAIAVLTGVVQIPSPYSRFTQLPSTIEETQAKDVNPTDALASLAFTGNTSALSSSALAALTSRLTHRASNELLTTSAPSSPASTKKSKKKGKSGDSTPPWTAAFSVTPFGAAGDKAVRIEAEGGDGAAAFDPYAEARTWKASVFGQKKRDEPRRRPSMAFFRHDKDRPSLDDSGKKPATASVSETAVPRRVRSRQNLGLGKREGSPATVRRWTLAMADVPDEVLVQELEKLRLEGRGGAASSREGSSSGHGTRRRGKRRAAAENEERGRSVQAWRIGGDDEDEDEEYSADERDASPAPSIAHSQSGSTQAHTTMPTALEDLEWKTARRALLCCRELVRTERNYQARLRQLLAGDTATPPPALVLTYVPALLRASEALLARLEDDPSAWGVSVAFVAVEDDAEAAFVAWAGVVGALFVDDHPAPEDARAHKMGKARNSSFTNVSDAVSRGLGKRTRSGASLAPPARAESVYRRRGASVCDPAPASPRPASMGLFTAALGTGLAYGISPTPAAVRGEACAPARPGPGPAAGGSAGTLSRTFSAWKTRRAGVFASSPSLSSPAGDAGDAEVPREKRPREKRPSVRELAILPVQRVMRYVLQYRGEWRRSLVWVGAGADGAVLDLLENTPVDSPSRALVERALESAMRIAGKCDRAQGNSAFLRRA